MHTGGPPTATAPGGRRRTRSRSDSGTLTVEVAAVDPTHARVRAQGDLSVATVDRLTGVLRDQLGWGRRHVRLDLSGVTGSSTGCLRALVAVHDQFLDTHGLLTICGVGPDLARLLSLSSLDHVLFLTDPVIGDDTDPFRRGAADAR